MRLFEIADTDLGKRWHELDDDYPLIKMIGERIGASAWTNWSEVGVPWDKTAMIGGGGTYMLKGSFGYVMLNAATTYSRGKPKSIMMSQIAVSDPGTGIGSKIMEAIKFYADLKNIPFVVYKVTNHEFFQKFGWLQQDGHDYVYTPLTQVTETEILDEIEVASSWIQDLTWDDGAVLLTLNNGKRYRVHDVNANTFRRWIAAPSKGKFWHLEMRGLHNVTRI